MEPILVTMLLNAALAAAPATDACSESARHQFDFWIGEWDVRKNDAGQESECRGAQGCAGTTAEGKLAGKSTITRVDGCALLEHWRGAAGSTGHSLNAYDAEAKVWRQFWVDNSGLVLRLEGGIENGAMVLGGTMGGVRQRITWTPRADGSVRQHWEHAEGSGWKTDFDGIYRHLDAAGGGAQQKGADANGLSGGT